jgi:hypothetical protein
VNVCIDFLLPWFAQPMALALFSLVPIALALWVYGSRHRQRALGRWATASLFARPRRWPARMTRLAALLLILGGTAGPLWGRDPLTPLAPGRDLLFLLDVSRSMKAEDRDGVARLARAKNYIGELLDVLQRQDDGYRIGLVVFAGQARLLCPLTADYDHVRFALVQADPDLLGPAGRLTPQGSNETAVGTSYGPATAKAVHVRDLEQTSALDLLLLTDGDDLAGDGPNSATTIRDAGLRLDVLGVGDPWRATKVPSGNPAAPYVTTVDSDEALPATTQRRDNVLQEMADRGKGTFFKEEAAAQPVVQWWQTNVRPLPARAREGDQRLLQVHRYGWFFAAALVFLTFEVAWGDSQSRRGW